MLTADLSPDYRDQILDHMIRVAAQVQRRRVAAAALEFGRAREQLAGTQLRHDRDDRALITGREPSPNELRIRELQWEPEKARSKADALEQELKARSVGFIKRILQSTVPTWR
jgi:hypothetical protein